MKSIFMFLLLTVAAPPTNASFNHYGSTTSLKSPRRIGGFNLSPVNHSHDRSDTLASTTRSSRTLAFITPDAILSTIGALGQHSQPYATAFAISAAKGVAADWVAQTSSIRKQVLQANNQHQEWQVSRGGAVAIASSQQVDMKRIMAFFLYSGIYQGAILEYMYSAIYPVLFGSSVIKKVAFSVFFLSPVLTLPLAYIVKGLVFRQSTADSIRQYLDDVVHKGLLTTYWAVWIPVKAIAFGVVPAHLRMTFLTGFGFLWMIMLSSMSSE